MANEIGGQHLRLLKEAHDLAQGDPAGLARMHQVAQRMGLDTVGKDKDRAEFLGLARELEEAGYVEKGGSEFAESFGSFSVTEEGRRRLEEGR